MITEVLVYMVGPDRPYGIHSLVPRLSPLASLLKPGDEATGYIDVFNYQERIRTPARVRACNSVKFETGQNLPPIL